MLLRLAYLAVTNAFTVLRLLPMSNRDKDVEIFAIASAASSTNTNMPPDLHG